MEKEKCWLYNECNHKDCDTFCMRKYKLEFLYNEGLITKEQRKRVKFNLDKDGTDFQEFTNLKKIDDNIVDFVNDGSNLYIHSTICGNGKTAWSLRLAQSYLNKIWVKSSLECRVLFINVPRLLLSLKDNISEKNEYVIHIKDNVLKADLVIWDEIGTKGLTQFEHENILSMVNARLDMNKSNIYTSNLSDYELHQSVGDRLYSRIVNNSLNVELHGSDKRAIYGRL